MNIEDNTWYWVHNDEGAFYVKYKDHEANLASHVIYVLGATQTRYWTNVTFSLEYCYAASKAKKRDYERAKAIVTNNNIRPNIHSTDLLGQ